LNKNSRLSLIFILFFPVLLKTIVLKFLNFDLPNAPTRFIFPSNKILLKKNEAVGLPQTAMADIKKTHFVLKSIHSSIRSESKMIHILTLIIVLIYFFLNLISGALSSYFIGFLKVDWKSISNLFLFIGSLLSCITLCVCYVTTSLNLVYIMYIMFCFVFQSMNVVARYN